MMITGFEGVANFRLQLSKTFLIASVGISSIVFFMKFLITFHCLAAK